IDAQGDRAAGLGGRRARVRRAAGEALVHSAERPRTGADLQGDARGPVEEDLGDYRGVARSDPDLGARRVEPGALRGDEGGAGNRLPVEREGVRLPRPEGRAPRPGPGRAKREL